MDDDGFVLVQAKKNKRACGKSKSKTSVLSVKTNCLSYLYNQKNSGEESGTSETLFCDLVEKEEIEFKKSDFFCNFVQNNLRKHKLIPSTRDVQCIEERSTRNPAISKIVRSTPSQS